MVEIEEQWDFYSLVRNQVSKNILEREDYNNDKDYDGSWEKYIIGHFFKYFSKYLNNEKEHFLSSIFTLSSHPPYNDTKRIREYF